MHRFLCRLGIHHNEGVGYDWVVGLFFRRCSVCKRSTIN